LITINKTGTSGWFDSLVDEVFSLMAGNSVHFGEIIQLVNVYCTWQNRQDRRRRRLYRML